MANLPQKRKMVPARVHRKACTDAAWRRINDTPEMFAYRIAYAQREVDLTFDTYKDRWERIQAGTLVVSWDDWFVRAPWAAGTLNWAEVEESERVSPGKRGGDYKDPREQPAEAPLKKTSWWRKLLG